MKRALHRTLKDITRKAVQASIGRRLFSHKSQCNHLLLKRLKIVAKKNALIVKKGQIFLSFQRRFDFLIQNQTGFNMENVRYQLDNDNQWLPDNAGETVNNNVVWPPGVLKPQSKIRIQFGVQGSGHRKINLRVEDKHIFDANYQGLRYEATSINPKTVSDDYKQSTTMISVKPKAGIARSYSESRIEYVQDIQRSDAKNLEKSQKGHNRKGSNTSDQSIKSTQSANAAAVSVEGGWLLEGMRSIQNELNWKWPGSGSIGNKYYREITQFHLANCWNTVFAAGMRGGLLGNENEQKEYLKRANSMHPQGSEHGRFFTQYFTRNPQFLRGAITYEEMRLTKYATFWPLVEQAIIRGSIHPGDVIVIGTNGKHVLLYVGNGIVLDCDARDDRLDVQAEKARVKRRDKKIALAKEHQSQKELFEATIDQGHKTPNKLKRAMTRHIKKELIDENWINEYYLGDSPYWGRFGTNLDGVYWGALPTVLPRPYPIQISHADKPGFGSVNIVASGGERLNGIRNQYCRLVHPGLNLSPSDIFLSKKAKPFIPLNNKKTMQELEIGPNTNLYVKPM